MICPSLESVVIRFANNIYPLLKEKGKEAYFHKESKK